MKVKDPTPPEERPGIVYKIKCICGDFYIGETGRSPTAKMKKHKAACRLGAFERSVVTEHAWQAGHEIVGMMLRYLIQQQTYRRGK